jgi:hypothetical protein
MWGEPRIKPGVWLPEMWLQVSSNVAMTEVCSYCIWYWTRSNQSNFLFFRLFLLAKSKHPKHTLFEIVILWLFFYFTLSMLTCHRYPLFILFIFHFLLICRVKHSSFILFTNFMSFSVCFGSFFIVSVQSKHRNTLFRYRIETTETNVLFRIVSKLVSVPFSVVSNRN